MPERNLYLTAYDISAPKRLRRALYTVKGHATGGQKSAYECFLTEGERREVLNELGNILDERDDAIILLKLDTRSKMIPLGIAVLADDPDFFYVG